MACVPAVGCFAHARRTLRRHKNGEYAAVTCGRPAFQQHELSAEGSDTAPAQKCRKNAKREFLLPPPTGLPPKPSEAVSVGRGRATERASPAACGGTRDSSSARTTASIAFVWSAAKPLPRQTHWAGHGPTPHFRAEARTHFKLRAFMRKRFYPPPAAQLQRGTSPPLRNPQLSEGTREIISERSLIMKKDIKFSTRMVSADREKIRALAAKATCP